MRSRTFGRTGWSVSEVGYGMWGLAGWTGSDDVESIGSLQRAIELGCTFFDTAWGYGEGHSERLLGKAVRVNPGRKFFVATKVPPKNFTWPPPKGARLDECFPPDHLREYAHKSYENLGVGAIDLLQFHVWEDEWANDERWQRVLEDLKREQIIKAVGVSVNRWEPANVLETLKTGQIDAVQVIYNLFDQSPEDQLFPICRELGIAVIARVPFDEGTLTGTLTNDSHWPRGDWRNMYFGPENLNASVARAEALRPLVPSGMTMPELALRWILSNPDVSTVIPGMRKINHVEANLRIADGVPLSASLLNSLRSHRWDRTPTSWSA